MKKSILFCFFFLINILTYSQVGTYKTYNGDWMSPVDTIRILNIFINIHYTMYPDSNPVPDTTSNWLPGPINTINQSPPAYLDDYIDTDFNPNNIHGYLTKFWAQASFNNFIVLGDFMSVDIADTCVTYKYPSGYFEYWELADSAISLINKNGGLQTIYGHDSIYDYDGSLISSNYRFVQKNELFNDSVDFVQFFYRNSTINYGGQEDGGHSGVPIGKKLLIGNKYRAIQGATTQGKMSNRDLSNPKAHPVEIHELTHDLIHMSNAGHMGGGGPLNVGDLVTVEGNAGGWSIFGGGKSCFSTISAYDRWILNWQHPDNDAYPICVQNQDSDIEKQDGNQTFYIRDFLTTGDAIRIKLPYTDPGALNQYIWLENRQIHNNGMIHIEFPYHWESPCKDDGLPGIYAYYQVGKDIRETNSLNVLKSPDLTDHIVPICADGNWDVMRSMNTVQNACINQDYYPIQDYYQQNPFCGYNDLKDHYFNSQEHDTINWKRDRTEILIKSIEGGPVEKIASQSGDNDDPFTGTSYINISSNPAPYNVITCHNDRDLYYGIITKSDRTDNRKVYINGLEIKMQDQGSGIFKVDVRWDNTSVQNDVRWSGDIVVKENLYLQSGNTIDLVQNKTPNLIIRDPVTGVFSGPTYFDIDSSNIFLRSNSTVNLSEKSTFIVNNGSYLQIEEGAKLVVNDGCGLIIKSGADMLVTGDGRIEIKSGGYLCIENGADINLYDIKSAINVYPGAHSGTNPQTARGTTSCMNLENVTFDGSGCMCFFDSDEKLQNETISNEVRYYCTDDMEIGYDVDAGSPTGPVNIENNSEVEINATGDVLLKNSFTVEEGSELIIE